VKFKRKKRIQSSPDITPLIDVVFLLLIFFMISTTFVHKPGIEITLPKASADLIKKRDKEIRVSVARDGTIFVDDRMIGIEELKKVFSAAAGSGDRSTLIIKADENTMHGKVVEIMDSAKEAGITKLAIATQQRGKRK